MTFDEIRSEFDRFIEFPSNEKSHVTVTSAMLFAKHIADQEREKLAAWMMQSGYATGHGDAIEELLKELELQVAEKVATEREACAEAAGIALLGADRALTERVLKTIRARSER
jgi:hypothetical protein